MTVKARTSARSRGAHVARLVAFAAALLLQAARAAAAGQAQQIQSFGANPTGIGMYLYTPSKVASKPAIFVGIHACGGKGLDVCGPGTAFSAQAEKYGFLLICPSSASSTGCWDVHSTAELKHGGGGDAAGIISMVDYVVKNKNGDASRVYVAGHSSGGMMTNIMLGSYPDVFKAGAAFAGVPFGCFAVGPVSAGGWNSACAQGKVTMTGSAWGDIVRAAYSGFSGTRPRMQVWHGTEDATVKFFNFGEEIKQWTNVLGVSATPVSTEDNAIRSSWIRTRYADAAGVVQVEAVQETGQPHNLVLDIAEAVHFFGLDGSKPVPDEGSAGAQGAAGSAGRDGSAGDASGASGAGADAAAGSGGIPGYAAAGGDGAGQDAGGGAIASGGIANSVGGAGAITAGALAVAGASPVGGESTQPELNSGGCSIGRAGGDRSAGNRFALGLLVAWAVSRVARRRRALPHAAPLLAVGLGALCAVGCAGSEGSPPTESGGALSASFAGSPVSSAGSALASGGTPSVSAGSAGSSAFSGAAGDPRASSAGSAGALHDGGGIGGVSAAGAAGVPSVDGGALDPGTDGDGDFTVGPTYTAAPESRTAAATHTGTVNKFTIASQNSAIYPSDIKTKQPFTRTVQVYVPYGYVTNTEVPFMVVQDGTRHQGQIIPVVDNLIASKKLPAMVIILIEPGPGDGTGSERSNEYDKVSGTYANFIETEVLPKVQTDYKLKLTTNPEGRAAFGGSSGGPAAFGMAWFHPELYRRVLTYSGSFVRLAPDTTYPHGAWGYHEMLIPGAEPKPLRVAIACGENDNSASNPASTFYNWVIANQNMAKVLSAKGYHYRFTYGKGAGHDDDKMIKQTLPETMLWLWRGYVAPN